MKFVQSSWLNYSPKTNCSNPSRDTKPCSKVPTFWRNPSPQSCIQNKLKQIHKRKIHMGKTCWWPHMICVNRHHNVSLLNDLRWCTELDFVFAVLLAAQIIITSDKDTEKLQCFTDRTPEIDIMFWWRMDLWVTGRYLTETESSGRTPPREGEEESFSQSKGSIQRKTHWWGWDALSASDEGWTERSEGSRQGGGHREQKCKTMGRKRKGRKLFFSLCFPFKDILTG